MENGQSRFFYSGFDSNQFASNDRLSAYVCGRFVEVCIAPEGRPSGYADPGKGSSGNKEPESKGSIIARSAARSRRQVRRLCNCNSMFYMHTLTFAVDHIKYFQGERQFVLVPLDDQRDRDKVISLWKAFVRKLRRKEVSKGRDFRYVAVIERHTGKRANDKTIKEGCYHIHFVSDTLYHKRQLQHIWRHGLCNHSDWTVGRKKRDLDEHDTLPPPDNPGAYLSKYIGKDGENVEGGKKRYWASRNLEKPVRIFGQEVGIACAGGLEIYRNERVLLTTEDGTNIKQTTLTYALPDTRHYNSIKGDLLYTRAAKREHNARKRLAYRNIMERCENVKEREDVYRNTSEGITDSIIERMRISQQAARERLKAFEIFSSGLETPALTRRKRAEDHHIKALWFCLGARRFELFARRWEKRLVCRSRNSIKGISG